MSDATLPPTPIGNRGMNDNAAMARVMDMLQEIEDRARKGPEPSFVDAVDLVNRLRGHVIRMYETPDSPG